MLQENSGSLQIYLGKFQNVQLLAPSQAAETRRSGSIFRDECLIVVFKVERSRTVVARNRAARLWKNNPCEGNGGSDKEGATRPSCVWVLH